MVKDRLAEVQRKEAANFLKRHPKHLYKEAEEVWVCVNPQQGDRQSTKLERLWKGPHKVQQRGGSLWVITEKGVQQVLHNVHMTSYTGPSDCYSPHLHYDTDASFVGNSPDWVLREILPHAPKGRKTESRWLARCQRYNKPEWQPVRQSCTRSQMHGWHTTANKP